jgi:hypothetical protein
MNVIIHLSVMEEQIYDSLINGILVHAKILFFWSVWML